jgi:hypothetical protein
MRVGLGNGKDAQVSTVGDCLGGLLKFVSVGVSEFQLRGKIITNRENNLLR